MEKTRISLDNLKTTSDALYAFYNDKGNTAKANGWQTVSSMFGQAIQKIDDIEKTIKDSRSLEGSKERIRELRSFIDTIVNKILEII